MDSKETGMIRGCSDQLCQGKPGTTLQKKCHLDKDLKNDGSLLGRGVGEGTLLGGLVAWIYS